jgi:hypothetical protein
VRSAFLNIRTIQENIPSPSINQDNQDNIPSALNNHQVFGSNKPTLGTRLSGRPNPSKSSRHEQAQYQNNQDNIPAA